MERHMCYNTWFDHLWEEFFGYRWALLAAFSVAVVVYGAELFTFSLSIDEELVMMHRTKAVFLEHGRWGAVLLKKILLPESFSPFFTSLSALVFLCVAGAVMGTALKLDDAERVSFCTMFVLFPQFAYQLSFSQQSDCVAFGLVCAAAAYCAFQHFVVSRQCLSLFVCLAAYTFATGVYQSLFFVPPTLYMADMLRRLLGKTVSDPHIRASLSLRDEWFRFFLFLAVLCGSLVLYVLCGIFFARFWSVPVSGYLASQVGWLTMPFTAALMESARAIGRHLAGRVYFGEVLFLWVYAFLATILAAHWRKLSAVGRCWLFIIALCMLLVPLLQVLLLGKAQAPRTLLGQGIVFSVLGTFALHRPAWHKGIVTAVIVICTGIAAAHTSQLFFENSLRWDADKLLANRIIERVYAVEPEFSTDITKLYIHGAPEETLFHIPTADTFGSSFFRHDSGNKYRTQAFFKVNGIATFARPSKEEITQILGEVEQMPAWPRGGSVKRVGEIVVVKLGQHSGFIDDVPYLPKNPE